MSKNIGDYVAQYNAKDVMLYAISIGLGSTSHKYNQDLRYVFEGHPEFTVFPTFALTLIFWATIRDNSTTNACSSIRPFPPPLMKAMSAIPTECLPEGIDLEDYPIIHTSQSVSWKRDMPIPNNTNVIIVIKGKFISVIPKSVGTFVTTEYECYESCLVDKSQSSLLCSILSTALILGVPNEVVQPFQSSESSPHICYNSIFLNRKKTLLFESDYRISHNTALLYRLASGDTNPIHVDSKAMPIFASFESTSSVEELGPLLHGLCTLSIATRMILEFLDSRRDCLSIRFLNANFVKPVFVNDTIVVQAWEMEHSSNEVLISFTVCRKKSGIVLLDNGCLQLLKNTKAKAFTKIRSHI